MKLSFHLGFNGQCQEAFEYYAQHLGGTIGTVLQFKDSAAVACVPASWQNKIVHASMVIEGIELAGSDLLPEQYQKPSGFYLALGIDTEVRVKSIFAKMAEDGDVILPPQKTFWSPCYGIVVDRYGVPWKLNCVT